MQGKTITGFDIDLIEEVAKRLNKTMQLQDMPFDGLISCLAIRKHSSNCCWHHPTPERAERIIFTKPYLTGINYLLSAERMLHSKNLNQLKGKKVAVNEGFTADYYMSKIPRA